MSAENVSNDNRPDAQKDDGCKWYILKTKVNCEARAKEALLKAAERIQAKDSVQEVMIPEREVIQVVKGKKTHRLQKVYPGYIFIKMRMTEGLWHAVQSTAHVSHFLGGGKPLEVPPQELDRVNKKVEDISQSPKAGISFVVGESVKVIDGPFKSFSGAVEEVNPEKGRVKVSVSIFGRPTPVDFDFAQVLKEI